MNKKNELREKIAWQIYQLPTDLAKFLHEASVSFEDAHSQNDLKILYNFVDVLIGENVQPELDAKDELIFAYESVRAPHACVPNLCGQLKEKDTEIKRLQERNQKLEEMTKRYRNDAKKLKKHIKKLLFLCQYCEHEIQNTGFCSSCYNRNTIEHRDIIKEREKENRRLQKRIKELEGMTEGYSNWVTEVIEGHPELFDIE